VKNMSIGERRMFFDSYIDEVVGRYSGKLQSWDIVNEPFWPWASRARRFPARAVVRRFRARLC